LKVNYIVWINIQYSLVGSTIKMVHLEQHTFKTILLIQCSRRSSRTLLRTLHLDQPQRINHQLVIRMKINMIKILTQYNHLYPRPLHPSINVHYWIVCQSPLLNHLINKLNYGSSSTYLLWIKDLKTKLNFVWIFQDKNFTEDRIKTRFHWK